MRKRIKQISENFHFLFHFLLGMSVYYMFYPTVPNKSALFAACFLATFLPDLDHFLYYYLYGRKTEYSKIVKDFLRTKQFKNWAKFCKSNHKNFSGLITHNILTPAISLFLYSFLLDKGRIVSASFFLAFALHFVFDMFEDLLFFGKLNKNWFLKFNKTYITKR